MLLLHHSIVFLMLLHGNFSLVLIVFLCFVLYWNYRLLLGNWLGYGWPHEHDGYRFMRGYPDIAWRW